MDPALAVIGAFARTPPDWAALRGSGALDRIESACHRASRGAPPEQSDDVLATVLLMMIADRGLLRLAERHLAAARAGEPSELLALVYATALRRARDALRPRYGDRARATDALPEGLGEEPAPSPRELIERVVGPAASAALARLVAGGLLDAGSADRWRTARLAERLGAPPMSEVAAAWGTTEGALRMACQRTSRRVARLLAARGDDTIGGLVAARQRGRLSTPEAVILAVWSEACADGAALRRLDPELPGGELRMDDARARYGVGSGRALGVYAAGAFEGLLAWSEEVDHGE